MTPKTPYGAREVEQLRQAGKRPANMLLVSLIGPLREQNPVIIANPGVGYDWRFAVGLDVLVVANSTIEPHLVKRTLDAIDHVAPDYLGLWLADRQDGISLRWGCFRPRSKAFRGLSLADKRAFEGLGR